ncbi:SRPBCC family protein [Sporosarcina thermotolerans]|uniref:SRPBCC family protein n=1 Tax=Sporosarcina thermotolerans TaxID=633404 RepID=A0AAW9AC94_9BACL|nr:SRPBCC family protein [Sporosarcina thermotolerans]MDW0117655.1 SRPBCC family protein [Sporosarcina thermotolerans]WHT49250.1 SRPBCC family protein [Sporosarcina thermotolerans]
MMNTNVTSKMKIYKPVDVVFEAIVDPEKMGGYWFSSGTSRVEQGKTITWRYEEYGAEGDIHVLSVKENKEIVFIWGGQDQETTVRLVFNAVDEESTILEVTESGLRADDPDVVSKMVGQTGGWVYMLTCLKGYLENGITTLRASLVH